VRDSWGTLQGVLCWHGNLTLNQDGVGSIPTPAANVAGQYRSSRPIPGAAIRNAKNVDDAFGPVTSPAQALVSRKAGRGTTGHGAVW
jgi:hypothetical protein